MPLPIYQVDAFTGVAFAGNPAAVCVLPAPRDEAWMRDVAREMNLSDTAFLHPHAEGFNLRWFTPTVEVELCGHATLASAHVMWEQGYLSRGEVARFYTRSGLLTAEQNSEWIEMDFPAQPESPAAAPPELLRALGVAPKYAGKNRFNYLIEVDTEQALRAIRPDFSLLASVAAHGVIVTARSDSPEYDFVSRFFAPQSGVNEDPVTGSAHCCLGPFWSGRLGRPALTGYQASARGGVIRVRVAGERVKLGGRAVTVLRGELL